MDIPCHIRVQQRNSRKYITTIQNLEHYITEEQIAYLVNFFQKTLNCHAHIVKDKEYGNIVQIQGNHCLHVKSILIDEKIIPAKNIVCHTF